MVTLCPITTHSFGDYKSHFWWSKVQRFFNDTWCQNEHLVSLKTLSVLTTYRSLKNRLKAQGQSVLWLQVVIFLWRLFSCGSGNRPCKQYLQFWSLSLLVFDCLSAYCNARFASWMPFICSYCPLHNYSLIFQPYCPLLFHQWVRIPQVFNLFFLLSVKHPSVYVMSVNTSTITIISTINSPYYHCTFQRSNHELFTIFYPLSMLLFNHSLSQ